MCPKKGLAAADILFLRGCGGKSCAVGDLNTPCNWAEPPSRPKGTSRHIAAMHLAAMQHILFAVASNADNDLLIFLNCCARSRGRPVKNSIALVVTHPCTLFREGLRQILMGTQFRPVHTAPEFD